MLLKIRRGNKLLKKVWNLFFAVKAFPFMVVEIRYVECYFEIYNLQSKIFNLIFHVKRQTIPATHKTPG